MTYHIHKSLKLTAAIWQNNMTHFCKKSLLWKSRWESYAGHLLHQSTEIPSTTYQHESTTVHLMSCSNWWPCDFLSFTSSISTRQVECLLIYEIDLAWSSWLAYHIRTHIAKSLQTHCKAIQNAVKKYNEAATALLPPRPSLDWSHVSHYSFLDKFETHRMIYKHSHGHSLPFARPSSNFIT